MRARRAVEPFRRRSERRTGGGGQRSERRLRWHRRREADMASDECCYAERTEIAGRCRASAIGHEQWMRGEGSKTKNRGSKLRSSVGTMRIRQSECRGPGTPLAQQTYHDRPQRLCMLPISNVHGSNGYSRCMIRGHRAARRQTARAAAGVWGDRDFALRPIPLLAPQWTCATYLVVAVYQSKLPSRAN